MSKNANFGFAFWSVRLWGEHVMGLLQEAFIKSFPILLFICETKSHHQAPMWMDPYVDCTIQKKKLLQVSAISVLLKILIGYSVLRSRTPAPSRPFYAAVD